jgi:hypothetical protein
VPLLGAQGVWLVDGPLSWFPFAQLREACAGSRPAARLEDVPYVEPSGVSGARLHDGRIYLTGRAGIRARGGCGVGSR